MSEEDAKAEEVGEEEEDTSQDEAADEGSGGEAEPAEPPPKKRGRKPAAPKAPKEPKEAKKAAAGGKKKKKVAKKHPKTMDMVIEAIDNLGERKGSSVQAIKAYILQNFKTVRPDMVKSMLRRALASGSDQGILVRPKGQAETQAMSGRYLLGKGARTGGDEDEVMPQQSRRAQEAAMKSKKAKGKKKGKKGKKVAKKPVARSVSSAKRPAKKTKGRK